MRLKRFLLFGVLFAVAIIIGAQAGAAVENGNLLAERHVLDNGLTVLIKQRPSGGQAIVQAWVRVGSYNEDESLSGISHFTEHMVINRGSRNFGPGELPKTVDRIGGEQNGFTSQDTTSFYIQAASDQTGLMLKMIADILFEATFESDQIAEECPVIEEELRLYRDEPGEIAFEHMMSLVFAGNGYARPIGGTVDTVRKVDHEAFLAYYKRFYVPGNMVLMVAGDVIPADVLKQIMAIFGPYPAGKIEKVPAPIVSVPSKPVVIMQENRDLEEGVAVGLLAMNVPPTPVRESAALDLLAEVFGGGSYSILAKANASSDTIDYVECSYQEFDRAGLFMIEVTGGSKKAKSFERTLTAGLKRMFSQVDRFDLEKARQRLMTEVMFASETLPGLTSMIGGMEVGGQGMEYTLEYLKCVSALTPADLKAAAEKYLNPKAYTLVIHYNSGN